MLLSDCNVRGRIHFGNLFLEKWTCEFWIWGKNKHFSENGSPGQTTMLTRRASKFWVEPRSPFSEISHHDPKTIGKAPNIAPLPECQPKLSGYIHFTFFHIIQWLRPCRRPLFQRSIWRKVAQSGDMRGFKNTKEGFQLCRCLSAAPKCVAP